jgi:hypothetical protein
MAATEHVVRSAALALAYRPRVLREVAAWEPESAEFDLVAQDLAALESSPSSASHPALGALIQQLKKVRRRSASRRQLQIPVVTRCMGRSHVIGFTRGESLSFWCLACTEPSPVQVSDQCVSMEVAFSLAGSSLRMGACPHNRRKPRRRRFGQPRGSQRAELAVGAGVAGAGRRLVRARRRRASGTCGRRCCVTWSHSG